MNRPWPTTVSQEMYVQGLMEPVPSLSYSNQPQAYAGIWRYIKYRPTSFLIQTVARNLFQRTSFCDVTVLIREFFFINV